MLTIQYESPSATAGGATVEKRAETDARAKPIELAALATDVPTGTVKLPTKSIPLPRSRPAIQTAAVQTVPAKPRPRRAVARTTQQDGFDNFFGFPSGRPQ